QIRALELLAGMALWPRMMLPFCRCLRPPARLGKASNGGLPIRACRHRVTVIRTPIETVPTRRAAACRVRRYGRPRPDHPQRATTRPITNGRCLDAYQFDQNGDSASWNRQYEKRDSVMPRYFPALVSGLMLITHIAHADELRDRANAI